MMRRQPGEDLLFLTSTTREEVRRTIKSLKHWQGIIIDEEDPVMMFKLRTAARTQQRSKKLGWELLIREIGPARLLVGRVTAAGKVRDVKKKGAG